MSQKSSRFRILHGDALDVLRRMKPNSIHAIVTDPPAGIAFMGKEWDDSKTWEYPISKHGFSDGGDRVAAPSISTSVNPTCRACGKRQRTWKGGPAACSCEAPEFDGGARHLEARDRFIKMMTAVMREALRVAKPGAHALVWAIPRTSHWTATALENAGWEIREKITHHFGCLSADTELLVGGRWLRYDELRVGDVALCFDVTDGTFSEEPIEEVFIYDHSDTAYRLFSDRTDQIVTREHRCVVECGGGFAFQVAASLECEARVPVLEDVSRVLDAVRVRDQGAGDAKQGVFGAVQIGAATAASAAYAQAASEMSLVQANFQAEIEQSTVEGEVLLAKMRGVASSQSSWRKEAPAADCQNGAIWLDGSEPKIAPSENVWSEQSGLEGRCDVLPEARQLQTNQVRSVPEEIFVDGAQGRLRDGASAEGSASDRASAAAARDGASRESRPAGQPDREPIAVSDESRAQAARAPRFTVADLVRVEPIYYEGKVWCVRVRTGAFVARRNGKVFVTGNSGFPKSLDVSKAIDKAAGAERTRAIGLKPGHEEFANRTTDGDTRFSDGAKRPWMDDPEARARYHMKFAPATEDAARWEGWGTALKPASEDWILCRKPLIGTVAQNVLQHGTGALHIDATRVHSGPSAGGSTSGATALGQGSGWNAHQNRETEIDRTMAAGRWPPNAVFSHAEGCRPIGTTVLTGDRLDGRQSEVGKRDGGFYAPGSDRGAAEPNARVYGDETVTEWNCVDGCPVAELNRQQHGAARFFPSFGYYSKSSRKDRNSGLEPTMRLREDLTDEQLRYVLTELKKAGLISEPGEDD